MTALGELLGCDLAARSAPADGPACLPQPACPGRPAATRRSSNASGLAGAELALRRLRPRGSAPACVDLKTYNVQVEDGYVFIGIE